MGPAKVRLGSMLFITTASGGKVEERGGGNNYDVHNVTKIQSWRKVMYVASTPAALRHLSKD